MKAPWPRYTSTPRLVKRAAESIGLSSARRRRIRRITAGKSIWTPPGTPTPNAPRGAHVGRRARGADQGLRGHAADVEAVAAHEIPLDQGHARAQPGRPGGGHEPGRAGADDDEVVTPRRRGVGPGERMDVGDERLVVLVPGLEPDRRRVAHAAARRERLARATRVRYTVTATVATSPTP